MNEAKPVRGSLEIGPDEAEVVRRIFTEFASDRSTRNTVKRLDEDGVPSPRGGLWNQSAVRGDPVKDVVVLNNPLYAGSLVRERREWRRNPDSEKRERRYRLHDQSEWVEVAVPDLRIIDDALFEAARSEIERRKHPVTASSSVGSKRVKHLLSGLICCSCCGANYAISGKNHYRCAGQKERGTCGNRVSVPDSDYEPVYLA
ncbi:recombinase family protein [Sphingomonas sp. LB3N6]|uniref:recombinase family protein n=1 Tax=Sphingomonas fucosidasi TaxID=3096164 RepID=UPI002FCA20ED